MGETFGMSNMVNDADAPQLKPVGVIRSVLKQRSKAPRQGSEALPTLGWRFVGLRGKPLRGWPLEMKSSF
jgi:hypothetical protein